MKLVTLVFVFLAYATLAALISLQNQPNVNVPTYDTTVPSCNIVTLCINVPVSVVSNFLVYVFNFFAFIFGLVFSGIDSTPWWINTLIFGFLLVRLGVMVYAGIRKGDMHD